MRKSSIAAVVAVLMLVTVVAVPAAFAEGASRDTVNTADNGLKGTSTLVRNNNGVSMTYQLEGLTPGNVYSAWVSINDFPPPAVFLAGMVVGGSGKATFAGHIDEGGILSDSRSDAVFIIIVDHGTKVPGSIREATLDPFFCGGGVCGPVIHAEHPAP